MAADKRLTIDVRMYRHSGIGRYLRNLLPLLLPRVVADKIRVIVTPGLVDDAQWLEDTRLEVYLTPAAVYSTAEQMLPLGRAFAETDLLWVPHYNVPLFYRGIMAVTIHDIAPIALPESLPNLVKRAYACRLIRHAASTASAFLCVSQFSADELVEHAGAHSGKITVTYPGIDVSWSHTHTNPAAVERGPYFLYVGNVKPNKNVGVLLSAFASVKDRLPHRLVLAGRMRGFGTGDDAVLRQAETMGDRVEFTGEIDDDALMALYAGADALVLPSLYEGFGLPLLEAMQMGCPIFASCAGSLPEVAGDAALYFDPRDPHALVETLMKVLDIAQMQGLRAAGQRRVRDFSYRQCAEKTAVVLNHLLAGAV